MRKLNRLAIIPARGGSKRIPRKNIKSFLGKPIIAYSIEAALKSNLFDSVMVSTDDPEIAEVSREYGAEIPFLRSSKNSDDYATTVAVILEVLDNFKRDGFFPQEICCIYPCAPFVTANRIIEAFNRMENEGYDSLFPVVQYSPPIQRAYIENNGRLVMLDKNNLNVRTQDLRSTYFDAGMFYWSKVSSLYSTNLLLTDNTGFVEISELETQDIDDEKDWKLAELKYELLQMSK